VIDLERLITESNEFEMKRRAEMADGLGLPLGILAIMGGFWYSIAQELRLNTDILSVALMVVLVFAALSMAVSGYFLWRAHIGMEYKALATAGELKTHFDEIERWVATAPKGEFDADETFTKHIVIRMIENADHNAEINSRRSAWILRQKQAMGIGIVLLSFSGLMNLICIWKDQLAVQPNSIGLPF
tara:strand:+ start:473 stop:1033 length:561 start_codon:yes stop_codon:yes gene_type:complete